MIDLNNSVPTVLAEVNFDKQEASGKYVCSICGYVYDPASMAVSLSRTCPTTGAAHAANRARRVSTRLNLAPLPAALFILR